MGPQVDLTSARVPSIGESCFRPSQLLLLGEGGSPGAHLGSPGASLLSQVPVSIPVDGWEKGEEESELLLLGSHLTQFEVDFLKN